MNRNNIIEGNGWYENWESWGFVRFENDTWKLRNENNKIIKSINKDIRIDIIEKY